MKFSKLFAFLLIASLTATLSLTPAFSLSEQANQNAKDMVKVSIPNNAREIGPGVFDLGFKIHDGKIVQGTLFVFSDEQFAKPEGSPGKGNNKGGNGGDSESTCFSYITKGAKWRDVEPWTVSTVNAPAGIDVTGILIDAVNEWENADATTPNSIFGPFDGNLDVEVATIGNSMNDQNEVAFGDITEDGVIAATWVWRTVSGPPQARYIAEWDQVYDVVSFSWINGDPNSMDFDNIATHEIGHSAGMGHPDSTCNDETMYAFASEGETKKRDLYTGDIAGVNGLY